MEIYCSDYQTLDTDHEPIHWNLKDPQRQTLWGEVAYRIGKWNEFEINNIVSMILILLSYSKYLINVFKYLKILYGTNFSIKNILYYLCYCCTLCNY